MIYVIKCFYPSKDKGKNNIITYFESTGMHTVLIVDDEILLRSALRKKLESAGLAVFEAENGDAALKMVLQQQVDLIVLDLLMPGLHGTDVIRKLHEMKKGNIPVIILTNVNTSSVQEGVEYLIKSDTSLDDIILRIRKRLGISVS